MDICDFHSHILPGADHGSSSIEVSLKQLRYAAKHGVTRIVATSHFYPHRDTVEGYIKQRNASYEALMSAIPAGEELPEVRLGAEILLCPSLNKLEGLSKLAINGTNTLLIELPFNDFGREYVHAIADLVADGYNIVLAHAECYPAENIEAMLEYGVHLQLNASAFMSVFRPRRIKEWLRHGKIVAIGSDIHNADRRAYKMFSIAKRKLGKYYPYVKRCSNEIWYASSASI